MKKQTSLKIIAAALINVILAQSALAADSRMDMLSAQGKKCDTAYNNQKLQYDQLEADLLRLRNTLIYESNDSQERDGHRAADLAANTACAAGMVASLVTGGVSVLLCFPELAVNLATVELDRRQGLAENPDLQSRLDRLNERINNVRAANYRNSLAEAAYRMEEHNQFPLGLGYFPLPRSISRQELDGIQVEFSKLSESKLMPILWEELTFAVRKLHERFSDCTTGAPTLNDIFKEVLQNRK